MRMRPAHCRFIRGRLCPRRWGRALSGLVAALALGAAAGPLACSGSGTIEEGPAYPSTLVQSTTLDIQVIRETTEIRITNTTGRSFGKSRLWINASYSLEIAGLKIGETITLPLSEFKDRYGANFRAGGFFAAEAPARLVLAQLQTDDQMFGLVVVGSLE